LVDKRKIALTDIIDALKQYGVIEQDRLELADNTKEESIVLKNILLSKWNEIGFDKKIIFHSLNESLPYWSYFYPASKERIENAKDWIRPDSILSHQLSILSLFTSCV
jgi:hypothetical protein